eukprot:CAMPEP_0117600414 /NCGR_PEP_ID=MMETSP0784-20121206/76476_1 /TAXON_ID=39447 /ORGANISM="" /LENGTH=34 /DNA_ID= /DNA_START= /DNA_END= /DNA_ORIENTATION=
MAFGGRDHATVSMAGPPAQAPAFVGVVSPLLKSP